MTHVATDMGELTLPALKRAAADAWLLELVRMGVLATGMTREQAYELGFAAGNAHMSEEQVRALLRKRVGEAGGQRAWARAHGFSAAYVNDVLLHRRSLSDNVCKALGITRTTIYTVEYT